ncbi:MAG TPA: RNA polymerase sigma factor [Silvibacterium sp.]|jgi:RNA polymerase sigma-70 factor (ECF subfamily)|nr:RNA polymerase sigma factor [Silvibacterium sp.]
MTIPNQDSTISLPLRGLSLPDTTAGAPAAAPTEIEIEVIALFDQLQERLFGYVLSFGLTVHDAEDVVQETFLSLFRHLQLGRSRRNLRGWIFRVAHNVALKRRTAMQAGSAGLTYDDAAVAHHDPSPSVEEQIAFSQRQRRLLAVLDALPEQDQRCLALRAEGLKYREIAEILGISLGSVSMSMARSLARLARSEGR